MTKWEDPDTTETLDIPDIPEALPRTTPTYTRTTTTTTAT